MGAPDAEAASDADRTPEALSETLVLEEREGEGEGEALDRTLEEALRDGGIMVALPEAQGDAEGEACALADKQGLADRLKVGRALAEAECERVGSGAEALAQALSEALRPLLREDEGVWEVVREAEALGEAREEGDAASVGEGDTLPLAHGEGGAQGDGLLDREGLSDADVQAVGDAEREGVPLALGERVGEAHALPLRDTGGDRDDVADAPTLREPLQIE